jgi:hypothetical protein
MGILAWTFHPGLFKIVTTKKPSASNNPLTNKGDE